MCVLCRSKLELLKVKCTLQGSLDYNEKHALGRHLLGKY